MRPEARSAARQAAIKESKEKKQEEAAKKKAEKAKLAGSKGQAGGRITSKAGAKGAQVKVAKATR